MSKYEWVTRSRNYDQEKKRHSLTPQPAPEHPLKYANITIVKTLAKSSPSSGAGTPRVSTPRAATPIDPLGGGDAADPLTSDLLDPLSQLSVGNPLQSAVSPSTDDAGDASSSTRSGHLGVDSFEPWSAKRAAILSKFTTFEKLTIASSFFADDAIDSEKLGAAGKEGASATSGTTTTTVSEKVRHRLEQLDDFEDGSVHELQNLSQREFIGHVDKLKSSMKEFWVQDQKVKALKIAIQCSKMLADTSVIRFYPSKFVLIADILDALGTLVYDRIFARSNQATGAGSNKTVSKLPVDFTHELVPNAAKVRNGLKRFSTTLGFFGRVFVLKPEFCLGFHSLNSSSPPLFHSRR